MFWEGRFFVVFPSLRSTRDLQNNISCFSEYPSVSLFGWCFKEIFPQTWQGTFPKTNSWSLKMDGWKTILSFWLSEFRPIFRGELLKLQGCMTLKDAWFIRWHGRTCQWNLATEVPSGTYQTCTCRPMRGYGFDFIWNMFQDIFQLSETWSRRSRINMTYTDHKSVICLYIYIQKFIFMNMNI